MKDVGPAPPAADGFFGTLTIPMVLFCAFQMTFAIITPALITGATADRMKFAAYADLHLDLARDRVLAGRALVFAGGWLAERARSTSRAGPSCT